MEQKKKIYVEYRNRGFWSLFPSNMSLIEASTLDGLLIKYEEDFVLCSKIEGVITTFNKNKFFGNSNTHI